VIFLIFLSSAKNTFFFVDFLYLFLLIFKKLDVLKGIIANPSFSSRVLSFLFLILPTVPTHLSTLLVWLRIFVELGQISRERKKKVFHQKLRIYNEVLQLGSTSSNKE